MSADGESLAEKQRRLSADIARQRGQFATAYRDIAKPILYTEYGLRGLGFLRQNPWVLTVIPAALSTTTAVLGLVRQFKPAKSVTPRQAKWFGLGREEEREVERAAKRESKGIANLAMKWGGRGWKLFRLYHKARKFFV